ncbi:MAG: PD-(D/E)XK nuclease family protein [bacterium]
MPQTIFLQKTELLASQVAEVLLKGDSQDLRRVEVWIPTAGAGRRIRRFLARKGVLSPHFTQPMRALLPDGLRLAERFEREGAWAKVLAGADVEFLQPLFSDAKLETVGARFKSGGVLCELCDLLAEAGWSPAHARLREVCAEDSERWSVLGGLYERYRAVLDEHGLTDPNEARFAEMASPRRAAGLTRLVIACIPDLPFAAQRYAEALEKRGVRIEVLAWLPGELSGGFDAWGRPESEDWKGCRMVLDSRQIRVSGSAEDEARWAVDFAVSAKKPGDYAVVLADPKLGSPFRSEVESRRGRAFLPEGGRLDLSEAGVLALEWQRFQSSGDLRVLRRLLELPRFSRMLRGDSPLKTDHALAVCDYLIGEAVLSDLSQAEAFAGVEFDEKLDKSKCRASVRAFVGLVKSLLSESTPDLLAKAWRSGGDGLEVAQKVGGLYKAVSLSPLYRNGEAGLDVAFFRALKAEPVFEVSEPGDVELSGWLEAPWLDAARLALCGCVEGCLPSSVNGHPFLPDSKRRALGLVDNASRFARDAYLFQCLLLTRPATEFRVSLSRFDAEGSPAWPSNLLLRCDEEALPARALELFKELPGGGTRSQRQNNWKWTLPENLRRKVDKISPTDFSEYLTCPFRYYFKKVQWLDSFKPDAREMDARRFGSLVHEALERFGQETPNESHPAKIERAVLGHLDAIVHTMFGPAPSPAVRIQIEAAKMRLRGFARVQAEEFAAGWRILAIERKLDALGENPFQIGPLNLSGKIDRIEKNDQSGAWRILDYKTHAKATAPARKHFGPRLSSDWLPAAEVEYIENGQAKASRWADLQLPLYRQILGHWYKSEIGDRPIITAYFTLSADPEETAVKEFSELSDGVFASAMQCATEIARRVQSGEFWPPQPFNTSWDDPFAALFLNGKPDACFTEETIAFLKGNL